MSLRAACRRACLGYSTRTQRRCVAARRTRRLVRPVGVDAVLVTENVQVIRGTSAETCQR